MVDGGTEEKNMTMETITLVLAGSTASMFVAVIGRYWNQDRRISKDSAFLVREANTERESIKDGYKRDILQTSLIIDQIEKDALEEISDPIINRLVEGEMRAIDTSLDTREMSKSLEDGFRAFESRVDSFRSAVEGNNERAKALHGHLMGIEDPITSLGSSLKGFSQIAGAFEEIGEEFAESVSEIQGIEDSFSMVADSMNIPREDDS